MWLFCVIGYLFSGFCIKSNFKNFKNTNLELENTDLKTSVPLTSKDAFAIIVGISNYPGSDYDLSYCDDDALEVYSMLINDYNFKPENIIYLEDDDATKNTISDAFDQIATQIDNDDLFFFYYSGHGGADTENSGNHSCSVFSLHPYSNNWDITWSIHHPEAAYMRVHFSRIDLESDYDYVYLGDTELFNDWYYEEYTGHHTNLWSGWIPLLSDHKLYIRMITDNSNTDWGFKIDMYEVETYNGIHFLNSYDSIPSSPENYFIDSLLDSKLDAFDCAEKYVVCDSCNSGGIIPEVQSIGRYIMMSCLEEESCLEDEDRQHGCFTYYLLRSNDYATDSNGDGVISIEECYNYIYSNTVTRSNDLGLVQHPQEYDGISGETVLNTTFGSLSLIPTGNSFAYSFDLFGTGLIEELKIVVYNITQDVKYEIKDLILSSPTNTGFGSYSGTIQLEGVSGFTGYGIFAKIQGNRLISLNNSVTDDLDDDLIEDVVEILYGLNPLTEDTDLDGLTDYYEFYGETDPLDPDTDNDGLKDGLEVNKYHTDPLNPDTDGDGYSDGLEVAWGADPLDPRISLTTIFLNITGFVLLAVLSSYVVYSQIIKKKRSKDEKLRSGKFLIDRDQNTYNILKIEKKFREKPSISPYRYESSYSPYTKPRIPLNQLDLNKIRDLILYNMPPPKPINSLEGQKALRIAKIAFEAITQSDYKKSIDLLVSALMLGVPEPMNSQIKSFLIDSLNRFKGASRLDSQDNLTAYRKCNSCGKLNKKTAKYCYYCGGLL